VILRQTILALCCGLLPFAALAEEPAVQGVGRIFNNDFFGDGHDRWRTGSWSVSVLRGPGWEGRPPAQPGRLLEWRLRTEMISPRHVTQAAPVDRPFVGALSFGLHGHWRAWGGDAVAGADLVLTGPQTRLGELHEMFHDIFSLPKPRAVETQLGDGAHASLAAAWSRPLRPAPGVTLRPFLEAQAGVEELLRVGADAILGPVGHDDLWLRDVVTGQLYRGIEGPATGLALVLGLDWAAVGDSLYLPDPHRPEDERLRARAGLHWQIAPETSFFYGLAWLSPEVEGQAEGQAIGSVKLNFNF
jgi:hypothetical protein